MFRNSFKRILLLLLAILVFSQLDLSGQQQDFELWNSINLRKDIIKDLRVEVEGGYRLDENITRTKAVLGEIGLAYKLKSWVRFKLNYRIATRIDFIEHRLKGDITFRTDIKRFRFSLRNRLQREWVLNKDPKDFLREKVKLEYNIRKFPVDPFISGEAWYRFSNIANQFEQLRADIGFNWNIASKSELDVLYRIMNDINVNNQDRSYVLGLEFTYSFD
jgi:hypothetical protein